MDTNKILDRKEIATMLYVDIVHGSRSVTQEDKDRAVEAASAVLGGHVIADVHAEFERQMAERDDYDLLEGDARLWVDAEAAADNALTTGWRYPAGAGCVLRFG